MTAPHMTNSGTESPRSVFLVVPWYRGSHKAWADAIVRHSRHSVSLVTHTGDHWRWRVNGGPVTLAADMAALASSEGSPDLVIVSSLTDAASLAGLARHVIGQAPLVVYQHESQLLYPRGTHQSLDPQELSSAAAEWRSLMAADQVWFNSNFHMAAYLTAIAAFHESLQTQPTHESFVPALATKSSVLPVGVELDDVRTRRLSPTEDPLVLFNQRWEADKAPTRVIRALEHAAGTGSSFRVALAGPRPQHGVRPAIDNQLRQRIVFDQEADRATYVQLLHDADIVISDAEHEFFGIGTVEAIAAGCVPLVPRRQNYPALVGEETWFLHDGHDLVPRLLDTLNALAGPDPFANELAKLGESIEQYNAAVVTAEVDRRIDRLLRR